MSRARDANGQSASSSDDFVVVGIGASAGGLDAFTRLLRHLPADTGNAYVLVQHLDANHPSHLSEILGRATTMPVAEATDGAGRAAQSRLRHPAERRADDCPVER